MRYLLLPSLLALGFTASAQVPDHVPADGLVIWLPLNGTVQSWSAQGVEWSVFGTSPATDRFGIEDQALGFNGSDDWAQSSEALIPSFGDFTISIWLHGMNNNAHSEAISQGGSLMNSTYIGNTPEGNIRVGGGADWSWDGIESYPFDLWAHFVIVKTSSLSTLYVNGEVISTSTAYTNPVNSGTTLLGEQNNLYGNEFWLGSIDDVGIWNRALTEQEVFALYNAESPTTGCTDELACNFNPDAVVDNGTCASCEQLQTACLEGTVWSEQLGGCIVANVSDTDFDGCVGINDFLIHLSNFGSGCGPESAWSCGDPLEYQGYDYETVQIGEQCWFAENLRAENYKNGDLIPAGLSDEDWSTTTSGATAVYGEGSSSCNTHSPDGDACDPNWSLAEYGRLYNWYAVNDIRGLCPMGWHVPTDGEFTTMTDGLGGNDVAGNYMKMTYGWNNGGNGTNASGYSGLPGGYRANNGDFTEAGLYGYWWSSSPIASDAWGRYLYFTHESVFSYQNEPQDGFLIRCIKDSE